MDNTSKKLFKKSFMGGFKREDVATYIAELAEEHAREVEALRSEIESAQNKITEMERKSAEDQKKIKELNASVDELSVKAEDGEITKAQLDALKEEFSTVKSEKETLEEEISNLRNEVSARDAKIAQYQSHEQEVRRNKEQIANLELDARKRSEQIEETAKARMEEERAAHKEYIEDEKRKLEEHRETVICEIEALVAKMAASYENTKSAVGDFKVGFKAVVTELAREIDSLSDSSLNVEDALNVLVADCKSIREDK